MTTFRHPKKKIAALASLLLLSLLVGPVTAQQSYDSGYYDQDAYAQDNLYHDYAARQQDQQVAG